MIDATGLEAVALSGRVVPLRWWCELLPLGVPSAGGVVVWHPDHVGVPGAELPAGARVPVDPAAAVVPLVRDLGGVTSRVGRVTAAWLEAGSVCVLGDLEPAAGPEVLAAWSSAGPAAAVAEFDNVAHAGDGAGGVDYFRLVAWRLRRVRLEGEPPARWPSPAGVVRWLGPGDPDPRR